MPRQREEEPLHPDEVEAHRQLVAVLVPEEPPYVLVRQVDLAEQDRLPVPPVHERAQVAKIVVRVRQVGRVQRTGRVEQERYGVHPEPGQPELEPEADHPLDLLAHLRVRDVEIRLMLVELVQVVLPRLLVVLPQAGLLIREDDALVRVRRRLVPPDVPAPVRRLPRRPRTPEPRVLVGGVVDHQVGDHPDATVPGERDQLHHVAVRTQPRIDPVEVGDVVPVVAVRRRIERHQPQARHPELGQVVDPLAHSPQVAASVTVGVEERLDVEAVDHRVLPPDVSSLRQAHAFPVPTGMRRAAVRRNVNL